MRVPRNRKEIEMRDREMKEENKGSICRRIAECWGFYRPAVTLLDCVFDNYWCVAAAFRVNGVGYRTDFRTLVMDSAYDGACE